MATLTEIGVRFNPPYLVAYYDCKLGSRRRKIPVRAIKDELETIMKKKLDSTKLADEIISKHKTYLGGSSRLQIVRLLEKILDHHHLDFVPSNQQKSQPSKLPEQSKPNVTEKNDTLKKSSDPVMSDIGHISTNSTLKQDLKDINYVTEKANSSKGIDPKNKVDAIVQIDTNKNLNKLTDEELANVKSLMQKDFEKNQIAKGSSNFTYDLKRDFGPQTEGNDWDSDEEASPVQAKSKIATISVSKSDSASTQQKVNNITPLIPAASNNTSALLAAPLPFLKSVPKKNEAKDLADDMDALLNELDFDDESSVKEKPNTDDSKQVVIQDKKEPIKEENVIDKTVDVSKDASKSEIQPFKTTTAAPIDISKSEVDQSHIKSDLKSGSLNSGILSLPKPSLSSLPALGGSLLGTLPPLGGLQKPLNPLKSMIPTPIGISVEKKMEPKADTERVDNSKSEKEIFDSIIKQEPRTAPTLNIGVSDITGSIETKALKDKTPIVSKLEADYISDDFEEDFHLDDDDEEDEEFSKLGKQSIAEKNTTANDLKAKGVEALAITNSIATRNKLVEQPNKIPLKPTNQSSIPINKNDNNKVDKDTSEKIVASDSLKAKDNEFKSLQPLTPQVTSLSSLANLPSLKMGSLFNDNELKSLKSDLQVEKKAADFQDDFGIGNTDSEGEEIVFSDDGLSLGSGNENDAF